MIWAPLINVYPPLFFGVEVEISVAFISDLDCTQTITIYIARYVGDKCIIIFFCDLGESTL